MKHRRGGLHKPKLCKYLHVNGEKKICTHLEKLNGKHDGSSIFIDTAICAKCIFNTIRRNF
ncbi:MAG: hypothetical protein JW795_17115, partial [Chitinivibrionales bacterium]|nr:hypothetical protein [Chitinivibrionales bacterium]